MQTIYDALLLISTSPTRATTILSDLSYRLPNFLQLLKEIAVQLRQKFQPNDAQSTIEYQKMSKQTLVILNMTIKKMFEVEGNSVYTKIEAIYQLLMELLCCQSISYVHKKVLEPALKLVLEGMVEQKRLFLEFLDGVTSRHMEVSGSVFLYLSALMESCVPEVVKLESIQESYNVMYYICLYTFNKTVNYYRNLKMQLQDHKTDLFSPFILALKQTEYILTTLNTMITFVCQFKTNNKRSISNDKIAEMLLNKDLALYLSRIMRIQQELLNSYRPNRYGLQVIIMTSFKAHQGKVLNSIKATCLTSITLILSYSDKKFNLGNTDKILLRDLSSLTQLVIQELAICSRQEVMAQINDDSSSMSLLSALIGVLSEAALFSDLHSCFQTMTVQCILRLTMGFLKTYEQESQLFENQPEEYFVLKFFTIFGSIDQDDDTLDCSLIQFCFKRSVVTLIKNMSVSIQGFTSILIEVCSDVMLLQMGVRQTKNKDIKQQFLGKYNLAADISKLINLQNALLTFAVVFKDYANSLERKTRFRFMLETLQLEYMTQIQLSQLYICLAIFCQEFKDNDLHTRWYYVIERVFRMGREVSSLGKLGYYFLQRLVQLQGYRNKQFCVLVDKMLNDANEWLPVADSPLVFQWLNRTIKLQNVRSKVINMSWINNCISSATKCLNRHFDNQHINHDLLTPVVILLTQLLKSGKYIMQLNQKLSYPTFQNEVDGFYQLLNRIMSDRMCYKLSEALLSRDMLNEEYHLIYSVGQLFFQLFVHDVRMVEVTLNRILVFTMQVLERKEEQNHSYSKMSFRLIYQLINRTPFDLGEREYLVIRGWMKLKLQNECHNQLCINQVCLILQLLYFYMSGNPFQKNNMINFFMVITTEIQRVFYRYLTDQKECMNFLQREQDGDIRRIKADTLHFSRYSGGKKSSAITIIRLYNSILLNPNFEDRIFQRVKEVLKFYLRETIPQYDLSVHFLAISGVMAKSRNATAVQCFRAGLELLDYNAQHQQSRRPSSDNQKTMMELTRQIQSPITIMDPYQQLYNMIHNQMRRTNRGTIFMRSPQAFQQIQFDLIECIKGDRYTLDLVKSLSSLRKVNDQPRLIRKIKRQY